MQWRYASSLVTIPSGCRHVEQSVNHARSSSIREEVCNTGVMCAAAICRKLYDRQGLGVGLLRKLYGKRNKTRGSRPEIHAKAAGGLIRHILIQLESAGLLERKDGNDKSARKLSSAVRAPGSALQECVCLPLIVAGASHLSCMLVQALSDIDLVCP
jgi:ribosomal protein S19E (S16A)